MKIHELTTCIHGLLIGTAVGLAGDSVAQSIVSADCAGAWFSAMVATVLN